MLLAALAPAAALGGIARRASLAEQAHRAARQVIADTLFDHMARGERARIARELHDVVAHHISMIAVQAETARLATPGMPAAGAQRLLEIGNTARAGLTEMRRLLGVLREDAQAASPSQLSPGQLNPGQLTADRRPQPGLQQLNELIDEARDAAGTGVRFIVSGPAASLDPGVELAAYRIVQEGLTNARRHAPGAAVDVELHFTDDALRLRIRDNGPGPRETARPRTARGGRSRADRHARTRRRRRGRAADRRRAGRRLPDRGQAAGQGGGGRMNVRIIVADDHHVVRTGFAAMLDTQPDFTVVGTASDGTEAVRICRELSPDVVLMDVRMPVMDGIEATRQLAGAGPDGSQARGS